MLIFCYGPENINLILSPPQGYFAVGSDISLTCSVGSRPPAQFNWFLNGDQLPDTGSELRLMNVHMSQSGNYSCQAFNSKTLRSQTSQPSAITVLENINLILSPPQGYFAVGSDISLTCSVGSRPPVQFKWFLNGDQLPDTGSELRLMNVQMSQSGNYSCQAFNNRTLRSQTSQPSTITVLGKFNLLLKNVRFMHSLLSGFSATSILSVTCFERGSYRRIFLSNQQPDSPGSLMRQKYSPIQLSTLKKRLNFLTVATRDGQ
uniref:Ig-like domain-containing protein n=1 Tax=Oreochromis niloticus TaxID=8128 RepID=A0A669B334_ORENI